MKQLRHIFPTVVRQLGEQTQDLNDLAYIKNKKLRFCYNILLQKNNPKTQGHPWSTAVSSAKKTKEATEHKTNVFENTLTNNLLQMLQMIITESLVILEIKERLLARHLSVLKGCLPLIFIFR